MAVNLSPVGGVAAQFFTNSGVILSGGKLYTYLAGTTTPTTAYTTSAGNVAWTNPIILNSAGRVSGSGEIWITDNVAYKFVLKDSNDVLIATYDNISGVSGLTLPIDSSNITYDPPFVDSVATNVEAKLAQYVSVKDFGAVGDGVADDTAAIQAALDNSYDVFFPAGNYKVSGTLTLRPYANLQGAGKVGYVTSYTENLGQGTRLIQTTNAFLLYTFSTGDIDDDYIGHITISDMTLLGGLVTQNEALRGTYGLACYSSQRMICNRVYAAFFSLSGFRFFGSLVATMHDCEADYNQNAGIEMDLGPFGTAETTNSYMSYILGGKCHQNKNYGVKLGSSTVRVSVTNVDIESTGNYYPTGLGVGLAITSESNTVAIEGCWFEGNKAHIVMGDGVSTVNVPKGTVLRNLELWAVVGSGPKIQILGGKNTKIDSCNFFGGGQITVNEFADAPIITNCYTDDIIRVADNNDFFVQYDNQPTGSVFPYPEITTWTTTNCTITVEQIPSPAGFVPVYKVTPTATGSVQFQSINAVYAFAKNFHTYGWFLKTSSATSTKFWPLLASVNIGKFYTSAEVNSFTANSEWKWYSIGRCINFNDTGNQAFSFITTVTTLDPFYITGFVALPGMVYEPYVQPSTGLPTLVGGATATPSVYGLTQALTAGAVTITNFTDGTVGQRFTLIAEHAVTITDGTNIFLNGSANFVMAATDTLTCIQKADGKWYEISRSDNT
jgi:hypothetical protein